MRMTIEILLKKTVYIIINSNPRINTHEKILSVFLTETNGYQQLDSYYRVKYYSFSEDYIRLL